MNNTAVLLLQMGGPDSLEAVKPFLLNPSGQFKNYPYRTYVGTNFQGGYSDHFPVFIYLLSKQ